MLGRHQKEIKEIKSLIEKRYNFNDEDNKVEIAIKPLPYDRNLSAAANVENLKFKLLSGIPVRLAANNILGTIMRRGGATGCEVMISGKVRGQRAKAQKYGQGYLISTGQPKEEFVDVAVRNVELRQGVLGLKVKVMQGVEIQHGAKKLVMPDQIRIHEPKEDDANIIPSVISSEQAPEEATPQ